jgi:hypothetical protein
MVARCLTDGCPTLDRGSGDHWSSVARFLAEDPTTLGWRSGYCPGPSGRRAVTMGVNAVGGCTGRPRGGPGTRGGGFETDVAAIATTLPAACPLDHRSGTRGEEGARHAQRGGPVYQGRTDCTARSCQADREGEGPGAPRRIASSSATPAGPSPRRCRRRTRSAAGSDHSAATISVSASRLLRISERENARRKSRPTSTLR